MKNNKRIGLQINNIEKLMLKKKHDVFRIPIFRLNSGVFVTCSVPIPTITPQTPSIKIHMGATKKKSWSQKIK